MCGLVGVAGRLTQASVKYFKQALIADYMRGKHSTGVAVINNNKSWIKKLALDPINFLDLKDVDNNLTAFADVIMGHNRHATQGAVNAANAHPFEHGDITLMHNGTLTNKYSLETKYKAPSFGTDSELVCWLFDNHNPEDIIPELIGAFALTWWDSKTETLNFVNNGERDFCYAVSGNSIIWASERKMLEWIADRNSIIIDRTVEPQKGVLETFEIGTTLGYKRKPVKLYTPPANVPVKYDYHPRAGGYNYPKSAELEFMENTKIPVRLGDTVYVWPSNYSGNYRSDNIDLEFTLAVEPFTTCKAWYATKTYGDVDKFRKIMAFQAEVSSVQRIKDHVSGRTSFQILLKTASLKPIRSKKDPLYIEYDNWCAKYEKPEEEVNPLNLDDDFLLKGFKNSDLPFKKFKEVMEKGCAMCGSPLDADAEVIDRSCTFIDDDNAVCEVCASDPESLRFLGYLTH